MSSDLIDHVVAGFAEFYNGIYNSYEEPADPLDDQSLGKLTGIIHSVETRFGEKPFEYVVAGIIIHTAMDHILINGNKRLSLILGYFCAHKLGYNMILLESNFARVIKTIVKELGLVEDRAKKRQLWQEYTKALAREIKDYSSPRESENIDPTSVASYFKR